MNFFYFDFAWVLSNYFFELRTCQPNHIEEANIWFDKELQRTVEDIVVDDSSFSGYLQSRVASLSIRVGKLSLYSAVEVASYVFVASRAQS